MMRPRPRRAFPVHNMPFSSFHKSSSPFCIFSSPLPVATRNLPPPVPAVLVLALALALEVISRRGSTSVCGWFCDGLLISLLDAVSSIFLLISRYEIQDTSDLVTNPVCTQSMSYNSYEFNLIVSFAGLWMDLTVTHRPWRAALHLIRALLSLRRASLCLSSVHRFLERKPRRMHLHSRAGNSPQLLLLLNATLQSRTRTCSSRPYSKDEVQHSEP